MELEANYNKEVSLREKIYTIIFEANTFYGKLFDVLLIITILISSTIIIMESVSDIQQSLGKVLNMAEWLFTALFSIEYILRLYSSPSKRKYIFSFFGIIDFISTFPVYAALMFGGIEIIMVVRIFRVLRVFRILKLFRFIEASKFLISSIWLSRHKILTFLGFIMTIVVIMGALMFIVEGPENGFTSIPKGIYWSIVTLTTVGYGDIAPSTNLGQTIASFIMILGYSIIAVPTGIITSEMNQQSNHSRNTAVCPRCKEVMHLKSANYCHRCGQDLDLE